MKFTKDRKAFRQTVFDFQNTRFTLANLKAKLQAGWAHLDWCTARHLQGELTAAEASAAKLFHTELQWEVCDAALQLHGGAGYMNEYPIARLWRDARVQRIYGGTSEIMKEVVARGRAPTPCGAGPVMSPLTRTITPSAPSWRAYWSRPLPYACSRARRRPRPTSMRASPMSWPSRPGRRS